MKENKFWEVKFKFKYPKESADDIRLIGNVDSLGLWDNNKAQKLYYDSKKDCWKTKSYIKIPALFELEYKYFELEYKYLIFKDNKLIEEEINSKRNVFIPEREKLVLSTEKNSLETNIKKHFTKIKKKSSSDVNKSNTKNTLKKNGIMKNSYQRTKNNETKENKNTIKFNISNDDNSSNEEFEKEQDDSNFNSLDYSSDARDEKIPDYQGPKYEKLNKNDDIIMCSTYVPFNPKREKDGSINFIYHTLYRVIKSNKNIKWFGNLKYLKKLNEKDRKEIIERLEKNNIFVFDIDESVYHKVTRLTEEVLEPLFHYTPFESSIMEDFNSINDHWKAYTEYNESVAKQISKHLTKNSLIYLNDINFLLVPNFLYSLYSCLIFYIHYENTIQKFYKI